MKFVVMSGDWEALTYTAKHHSPLHTISRFDPPSRLHHNRRILLILNVALRRVFISSEGTIIQPVH